MARKANKVVPITGTAKLDRATSSWRALTQALPKLKLHEVERLIEVEKPRRAGRRDSILEKLLARYGKLQKLHIRNAKVPKNDNARLGNRSN